jgi:two-component system, cell cycle sensor histidine kinase and response regulator CckA
VSDSSPPVAVPPLATGVSWSPAVTVPNRAFQAVLDAVPGAWFFARRDGSFAYANRGAWSSLGYSREEFETCTVFDIDPEMQPETWAMLWSMPHSGDSPIIRTRHRRKDGSSFPVEVRASRVIIEGEELAVSYTVDLTASERTQVALVETEIVNRRLLAAIEQASEAVVVTDASGRVEYVNPAYEQTTGLSAAEVRGRAWVELEIDQDLAFVRELPGMLSSGEGYKGRVRSRRRSGERLDEDVSVSPIRDDRGALVGHVAVKRDITEQLRLEQQLRHAQKVEAVGQLAGGIAHDFNNLLQVIHGQAHLIRLQSTDDVPEPMLEEIAKAVARASSLVRQLLAFSRKGTIEYTELRFDELVSTLNGMLGRLLGEHIELEWIPSARPVYVRGNAPQLEQVVANLCINARDAMPDGGRLSLKLSIAAEPDLPSPPMGFVPGKTLLLTVTDNGHGMSEEVLSRLFEPFFTTKEPGRGTGLGLATVYAIVQAHSGTIDVRSRPGEGATFRVFLPMVEAALEQREEGQRAQPIRGGGRVALVAEDEPAVRLVTAGYLERAGFRVLSVKDGVEADRLLSSPNHGICVAVLDAVMPRRGGQAVYDALAARGKAIPVVFVTGYDYESLVETAHRPGVAILQKPFSEDELLGQVAHVLGEPLSARV